MAAAAAPAISVCQTNAHWPQWGEPNLRIAVGKPASPIRL